MAASSRVCLLLVLLLAPAAVADDGDPVLVSAAVSLRDVLGEAWETGAILNVAGSGHLLRQILQGAPVDLFVSASPWELDELERHGLLVPGSRCTLASNRLVVILPPDGPPVRSFEDLPGAVTGRIAVGNPKTVPAGRYAQAALRSAGHWDRLEHRIVFAGNVRQVVEYVARGDAGAGLVYATDARRYRERLSAGPEVPAAGHPPILYQAALIREGPNLDRAEAMLAWLRSDAGRDLFRRHGFGAPP